MKIAFAIVAIAAAGVIFWVNRPGAVSLPDSQDTQTTWMCRECKHVFKLTAAEAAREEARAGGPSPLYCPACGKKEAYRVAQCETCGTYYFSRDVPGSLGRCEVCFPRTPDDESDDAPTEQRERLRRDSPPSL